MSDKEDLSPVKRWGLAVGAVLAKQNGYDHHTLYGRVVTQQDIAQQLRGFSRDWSMNNVEDFHQKQNTLLNEGFRSRFAEKRSFLSALTEAGQHEFLQSLSPDTVEYREYVVVSLYYRKLPLAGIAAFDYGRVVNNCRGAALVGFIREEEAWEQILQVARLVQADYAGWQEYAAAYLVGRQYWRDDLSKEFVEKQVSLVRELLLSEESPWRQLAWDTKLD